MKFYMPTFIFLQQKNVYKTLKMKIFKVYNFNKHNLKEKVKDYILSYLH